MNKGQKFVVGNWKMGPKSIAEAKKLFMAIAPSIPRGVRTIVLPPTLYFYELRKQYTGSSVLFGLQNIFSEREGSFTGETGVLMAQNIGATHVLIGHSERRAQGETDELVARKVTLALASRLVVILCIGEKERDSHGEYLAILKKQLLSALVSVTFSQLKNIMIAYEPVWAIGKGADFSMKPGDVHEAVLLIRKILHERYLGKKEVFSVPILYGGSVVPENASALVYKGEVDGLLVGHQSLDVRAFTEILKIVGKGGEKKLVF